MKIKFRHFVWNSEKNRLEISYEGEDGLVLDSFYLEEDYLKSGVDHTYLMNFRLKYSLETYENIQAQKGNDIDNL